MLDARLHSRLWPQIRTKSQMRAGILFKKRGAQGSHACLHFVRPFFLAPKYFQAPATQDSSTSPPTSTSGSATDIISIQPKNNTFLFFKKKKKGREHSTWIDPWPVVTFYFALLPYSFSLQLQNPDYLRLSCGCFQIVSVLWLVTRCLRADKRAGSERSTAFLQLCWTN